MKQVFIWMCCLLLTTMLSAQEVDGVTVASVELHEGYAAVELVTATPFIIGGNRYVLHIGDAVFIKSIHPDGNEYMLTFYIPIEEWEHIASGQQAVLVYGLYRENTLEQSRAQQGISGLYASLGSIK